MGLVMWGIREKIVLESRAVGGTSVELFKENITVTQVFQLNTKLTVNKVSGYCEPNLARLGSP